MTSLLNWKLEPRFPPAEAEEDDDDWCNSECEENIFKIEDGNFGSLSKGEIARQLLNDIENIGKKDDGDAFSDWLEEKINVPIFDEVQPVQSGEKLDSGANEQVPEVDGASEDVDLTPPDGPGRQEAEQFVILNLDGIQSLLSADEPGANFGGKSDDCLPRPETEGFPRCVRPQEVFRPGAAEEDLSAAPPTPMSHLEKEMAVVDEVIRSTARSLGGSFDCCESEACSSASINSFGSHESLSVEDESDISDWSPFPKKEPRKTEKAGQRWGPYERQRKQEDRWIRKKEQNKNAAVRYRLKKKAELSEILEEERALNEKKEELERKVYDMQTEIKYLKGLMRDLFRAKGLLIH